MKSGSHFIFLNSTNNYFTYIYILLIIILVISKSCPNKIYWIYFDIIKKRLNNSLPIDSYNFT